VYITADSKHST